MSEVIRSERGQAVLISLRNGPDESRGQDAPAGRSVWREPLRGRGGRNTGPVCGVMPAAGRRIGALAQLGERLICIQEVIGSIPIGSTK